MLFEGVKLMVVGMTTVMLFLLLMIYCMKIVAFLTRGSAAREIQEIASDRAALARKRQKPQPAVAAQPAVAVSDGGADFAVIAAAVAAYESDMGIRD
jgi:sodium pump decarboxylase gamma subunit